MNPESEIVITASGVQALNLTIRCAIDPGDEAILLTPAWPNATSAVLMDNGPHHEVPLQFRSGRYRLGDQRARPFSGYGYMGISHPLSKLA